MARKKTGQALESAGCVLHGKQTPPFTKANTLVSSVGGEEGDRMSAVRLGGVLFPLSDAMDLSIFAS